jgi:hypothetical protein
LFLGGAAVCRRGKTFLLTCDLGFTSLLKNSGSYQVTASAATQVAQNQSRLQPLDVATCEKISVSADCSAHNR